MRNILRYLCLFWVLFFYASCSFAQYTVQNPPPAPPYTHPVSLDSGWVEITSQTEIYKGRCSDWREFLYINHPENADSLRKEILGVVIRDSLSYFKFRRYDPEPHMWCYDSGYCAYFPRIDFSQKNILYYETSTSGCVRATYEYHFYVNHIKKEYLLFVQLGYWGNCLASRGFFTELIVPKLPAGYTIKFRKIEKPRD